MFQTMQACTDFIFKLKASQYKGEPLESARLILRELGNPERQMKFIHIAGSNGKGSTLNATREILMAHGLQIGAFISPHLERPNERVTINKQQISDEDFLYYANKIADVVKNKLDGKFPSFFEFMTLIALQYFAVKQPDFAILETGIGGRLDSTNVITPEVSIITTISLEHTDMLGDTYTKIAAEKAGIIKVGKPVVVGVRHIEARAVIEQQAQAVGAPRYILNKDFTAYGTQEGGFTYVGQQTIENIALAMAGLHQVDNAALAITAAGLVYPKLDAEKVKQALQNAKWEGRFERITENIILDGAHNSEGTTALIKTLQQVEPNKRYNFIYAALQDKDHQVSIDLMDRVASVIHFTQIKLPRAATAQGLFEQSAHPHKTATANWQVLLDTQLLHLQQDEVLIITGSLYFIAEVRHYFIGKGVLQ